MRLLLDTHVVLWAISEPERLSDIAQRTVLETGNERLVSSVTPWELAIKSNTGKWRSDRGVEGVIETARRDLGIRELPISVEHALATAGLPTIHSDPFDRMLVAQALTENLTIVTTDSRIARYGAQVIW